MAKTIEAELMASVPLLTGPSNYLAWEDAITSVLRNLGIWSRVGGIEVLNAEIEAAAKTAAGPAASDVEKDLSTQVELINILDDDDEDMSFEREKKALFSEKEDGKSEKEWLREQTDEQADEETKETANLRKEFRRRIDQLGRQKQQLKEELQARKDAEASWLIMRNVEPSVVAQIRTLSTAREMWKKLQFLYIGAKPMQRQLVYARLARLTYENCKSMQDYVNEYQELVAQMKQLDRPLSKFHATHQLLVGLGLHYQDFQDRKHSIGDELEDQPLASLCAELVAEESNANAELRTPTFPFTVPAQERQPLNNVIAEAVREEQWAYEGTETTSLPFAVPASSHQPPDDVVADVVNEENDAAETGMESPMIANTTSGQNWQEPQVQQPNDDKHSAVVDEENADNNTETKTFPFSFNLPTQKEEWKHERTRSHIRTANPLEMPAQASPKRSKAPKKKKNDYCKHCQKYGHTEEGCRALHYQLRSTVKNISDSSKHKDPSTSSSEVSFSYTPARNPNRNWW